MQGMNLGTNLTAGAPELWQRSALVLPTAVVVPTQSSNASLSPVNGRDVMFCLQGDGQSSTASAALSTSSFPSVSSTCFNPDKDASSSLFHSETLHGRGASFAILVPCVPSFVFVFIALAGGSEAKKRRKRLDCTFCGKEFKRNFLYNQHIRKHTGQRPYQCMICGRAFVSNSNVKRHLESHKVWPHIAAEPAEADAVINRTEKLCVPEISSKMDDGTVSLQLLTSCSYCQQVRFSLRL